jgi:hypothetical protein
LYSCGRKKRTVQKIEFKKYYPGENGKDLMTIDENYKGHDGKEVNFIKI